MMTISYIAVLVLVLFISYSTANITDEEARIVVSLVPKSVSPEECVDQNSCAYMCGKDGFTVTEAMYLVDKSDDKSNVKVEFQMVPKFSTVGDCTCNEIKGKGTLTVSDKKVKYEFMANGTEIDGSALSMYNGDYIAMTMNVDGREYDGFFNATSEIGSISYAENNRTCTLDYDMQFKSANIIEEKITVALVPKSITPEECADENSCAYMCRMEGYTVKETLSMDGPENKFNMEMIPKNSTVGDCTCDKIKLKGTFTLSDDYVEYKVKSSDGTEHEGFYNSTSKMGSISFKEDSRTCTLNYDVIV